MDSCHITIIFKKSSYSQNTLNAIKPCLVIERLSTDIKAENQIFDIRYSSASSTIPISSDNNNKYLVTFYYL